MSNARIDTDVNGAFTRYNMEFPSQSVQWDAEALDTVIKSHGVELIHYSAMRCPIGLTDQYDSRRPHSDHSNCSNGFIYTNKGKVTALFSSNNADEKKNETGLLAYSGASVTVPRYYDDSSTEIRILPFDRFYLNEPTILVADWQLVEAHVTGYDKLNFPVVEVTDLIDSAGVRYSLGDFGIVNGQICWSGQHQPGVDPATGKGRIYSCRYNYQPYYYISDLTHEIRVRQTENEITGVKTVEQMPKTCRVQREYVFLNEQADPDAVNPDRQRQQKGPRDGQFGPR